MFLFQDTVKKISNVRTISDSTPTTHPVINIGNVTIM